MANPLNLLWIRHWTQFTDQQKLYKNKDERKHTRTQWGHYQNETTTKEQPP